MILICIYVYDISIISKYISSYKYLNQLYEIYPFLEKDE